MFTVFSRLNPVAIPEHIRKEPSRSALLIAAIYVVVAAAYILFSTRLASQFAEDLESFAYMETVKGLVFIGLTGIGLFFLTRHFLRRLSGQMESNLEKERQLEAEENRAIAKSMVGSIAHDSNNMLATILFGSDLLRAQGNFTDKQLETLGRIKSAGEQIRELNTRLIEASRYDNQLPVDVFDAREVMEEVRQLAKASQRLHQARTQLHVECKEPARVRANRHLLLQAVQNLVFNAIDASGAQGEVRIEVHPGEDRIDIEVHDNGPGVPAEVRERIFHPFYSEKANGHGLGLVAVRACAKAFDGEVDVGSSPLGGARFRLSLPHADQAAA